MANPNPRGLKILAALMAGGLLVVVISAALLFKPILRSYVVRQARERGIELTLGDVGFSFGSVSVDNATFRLSGVDGLSGKLAHADVIVSGLTPKSVQARGIDLRIDGVPEPVLLELTQWLKVYAADFDLPLTAGAVTLEWRSGRRTWLALSGGTLAPLPAGLAFHAAQTKVAGAPLGPVDIGIDGKSSKLTAALGGEAGRNALLRAVIAYAGEHPSADFSLARTQLSEFASLFAVKLPVRGVRASASAHLTLDRTAPGGPIPGTARLQLIGFVPPHPRELDGIVFGDTTSVSTKFEIESDRKRVVLSDIHLGAGAFKLGGAGLVTREADHAHIQLSLRGNLACTAIASSAAQSRLGRVVGGWIARAAARAVQGTVTVIVKVDAESDHLTDAKVLRTIGVGCGLKPLKLPSIDFPSVDLGHLPALPNLPSPSGLPSAPSLPSALPGLPSNLPSLPSLPSLPGLGTATTKSSSKKTPAKSSKSRPKPSTTKPP